MKDTAGFPYGSRYLNLEFLCSWGCLKYYPLAQLDRVTAFMWNVAGSIPVWVTLMLVTIELVLLLNKENVVDCAKRLGSLPS